MLLTSVARQHHAIREIRRDRSFGQNSVEVNLVASLPSIMGPDLDADKVVLGLEDLSLLRGIGEMASSKTARIHSVQSCCKQTDKTSFLEADFGLDLEAIELGLRYPWDHRKVIDEPHKRPRREEHGL